MYRIDALDGSVFASTIFGDDACDVVGLAHQLDANFPDVLFKALDDYRQGPVSKETLLKAMADEKLVALGALGFERDI